MKRFSPLAVILFVLAIAGPVMADARRPARPVEPIRYRWGLDDAILSKLNLTPEQVEKARLLRHAFKEAIAPLRAQVIEKRTELGFLWTQTRLDAERIRVLERELHDLIGQIREQSTTYRLNFRALLTPEQVSKWVTLVGERYQRHRDKKERSH